MLSDLIPSRLSRLSTHVQNWFWSSYLRPGELGWCASIQWTHLAHYHSMMRARKEGETMAAIDYIVCGIVGTEMRNSRVHKKRYRRALRFLYRLDDGTMVTIPQDDYEKKIAAEDRCGYPKGFN
jgi:hypothetical protein